MHLGGDSGIRGDGISIVTSTDTPRDPQPALTTTTSNGNDSFPGPIISMDTGSEAIDDTVGRDMMNSADSSGLSSVLGERKKEIGAEDHDNPSSLPASDGQEQKQDCESRGDGGATTGAASPSRFSSGSRRSNDKGELPSMLINAYLFRLTD